MLHTNIDLLQNHNDKTNYNCINEHQKVCLRPVMSQFLKRAALSLSYSCCYNSTCRCFRLQFIQRKQKNSLPGPSPGKAASSKRHKSPLQRCMHFESRIVTQVKSLLPVRMSQGKMWHEWKTDVSMDGLHITKEREIKNARVKECARESYN